MKSLEGCFMQPFKQVKEARYLQINNTNWKSNNWVVNKGSFNYNSFSQKREYLYKIMLEIWKLTGPQGLLQNKVEGQGGCLFENVESFFKSITSSTFQQNIVKALIDLSEKMKEGREITIEDQKEFLNQIKCDAQNTDNSLQNKKKMKAQKKLVGLLQQQDQTQDQITESFTNIQKNLIEIFLKEN
ncbi:unnamed protein product (macronuclear) [Paramecium tetraurelia]|uniref:Uncharacterized protein n=1 Tax=Paramecium tetraurelia TaxID=5888 RepID=A0DLJ2_PARTE|nr:uncharacterized protein GSPATT00018226001 [Paramecium tetraurelia]CAK83909.1 unnamed protein product [Paramecium tetraurelia]|eukprot:XP_001451306.1 hypothetical protein (macronuclear) [Paramecium tetraurelia strain d4-2]